MSKDTRPERFSASGLTVKAVYNADDVNSPSGAAPGTFPFTRGIHSSMYRGKLWTMRQYAGFGTAGETNARFRYLLKQGGTGLSVAFDLPTQMGRDSDHPLAKGEVGRVGVAISSLADMETLLAEIPLEKVSISMTINSTAAILLGMLLVIAEKRGIPWAALQGTIQNDVLKEYIARGTYVYPPRAAVRIVTDIFEFCAKKVPQWNTISVSGYHIREAGSTAVEELAFTLGNAICYLESAKAAGLEVDDVAPRMAFFFNCHNDFLEEIAKFRAARKIWAKLIKERFKSENPRSQILRFHTQTAGSSLTAQQPLNNVIRTAYQAMAAVLGGTQSLHTNSYDEALGLPTNSSALLALRSQQILATETGVAQVADPFGGSYVIEAWTERLEKEVMTRLDLIENMGGMLSAIEAQYPQGEIEKSAYRYQRGLEDQTIQVVGVNCFKQDAEDNLDTQALDPKGEPEQVARLKLYRANRKPGVLETEVKKLCEAARGKDNLLEAVVRAVRAELTLGEISDALRTVFGEYREQGV